ncbi:MAG TPA: methyltransferase domain-containing protein [Beijerinckiaceae bacterium]|nr:methyltransferase domain-containing protein [Beijerinckiaceae bacterium]
MTSWVDFWNRDPSIYVNERHKMLHYRQVARDIAGLIDNGQARVLDHGSGEATSADLVAARCAELVLCDAAPNTRARIAAQFAGKDTIRAMAPEDLPSLPDGHFDLIVANSVLQYLDEVTLEASLEEWKRLLKPDGRLILADVIPPNVSPLADARALLGFAMTGGFLVAAIGGLIRTALSDYRKLRSELGFSTHSEADLVARLQRHGFAVRRLDHNIGHNPARMSFEARPVSES